MQGGTKEAGANTLDHILSEANSAAQKALTEGSATIDIDPSLLIGLTSKSAAFLDSTVSFLHDENYQGGMSSKPHRLVVTAIRHKLSQNPEFDQQLAMEVVETRPQDAKLSRLERLVLHRRDTDAFAAKTNLMLNQMPEGIFSFATHP
ncbi:MAG: hypothetical protein UX85_C0001G0168 [Candidatus Beckwithbacteria bacterium GW2011_GWB1_47_15]|uniref:Uncharacterized protein n=1 Tax=Candidatus Beckwithbacteria bacterium GW2011_GWB1_47_15 TaxID=1618371 RepID=A0A0G1RX95_9BACT|nr:MAG: hypothetical protein UY43_C0001G0958 [Candidatus Beckwithbacteria bacterium GW2011_GWC1_49_16]AQS30805.1 hypothetical protein [uncultured bacterium]KKU35990.1 MAG: hypothetical protein UX50_C0001G0167 [Candidatus Beckwithbacteria bacterium GW2011_GWA1_46_30]KKU61954.1 MAG: hypothetical protein UX85_C0001G0168 [Candidatus Beckwithbacteria bacterium GW2011_GWB1_47_15]KKU72492.1 MAG: hypothetical protein UX97_C0001G0362 [Candidatus Beckwithbacteria bacterium GW2011_GWA2_47_25]KKW04341.1 M